MSLPKTVIEVVCAIVSTKFYTYRSVSYLSNTIKYGPVVPVMVLRTSRYGPTELKSQQKR